MIGDRPIERLRAGDGATASSVEGGSATAQRDDQGTVPAAFMSAVQQGYVTSWEINDDVLESTQAKEQRARYHRRITC